MHRRQVPVAFCLWGVVFTAAVPAAQPPTLTSLLGAAAAYVAQYESRVAALVLQEEYTQTLRRRDGRPELQERRMRSEVVLVRTARSGWTALRDVFEVDGAAVHDRQDRLQTLLMDAPDGVFEKARAIVDEGARFNLGRVRRNLNYPTMALLFLRGELQDRSRFSRGGSERIGDVTTWTVEFRETARPSLIETSSPNTSVSGRFWIEPESGRVWRSLLTLEEERSTATFDVLYDVRPDLNVLVPASLSEDLVFRDGLYRPFPVAEVVTGRARYSNVKQFSVQVDTLIPASPEPRD